MTASARLESLLTRICYWTGRIAAWGTLAMVVVMFAVVVLRYLFGMGSIALQESVLYFHSVVFLLGAAWTLADDQHVRVDVFYRGFSTSRRAWVDLAGTLLFLFPVAVMLLATSRGYVADSWAVREASREAGGLAYVYLLKTLIPVAALLLLLQGIAIVLRCIDVIRSRG